MDTNAVNTESLKQMAIQQATQIAAAYDGEASGLEKPIEELTKTLIAVDETDWSVALLADLPLCVRDRVIDACFSLYA